MHPNGLKRLTIVGNPHCGYVLTWQEANRTITCTRHLPTVPERVRTTARAEGYAIEDKEVTWDVLTNPYTV